MSLKTYFLSEKQTMHAHIACIPACRCVSTALLTTGSMYVSIFYVQVGFIVNKN